MLFRRTTPAKVLINKAGDSCGVRGGPAQRKYNVNPSTVRDGIPGGTGAGSRECGQEGALDKNRVSLN